MNNKQQTAVDSFAEKTFNLIELMKRKWVNQDEFLDGILKARNEAKEMEKEKAIKLYIDYENYLHEEFKHQNGGQAVILSFREFYEQTYGGNK
jgi:hypothetical protein